MNKETIKTRISSVQYLNEDTLHIDIKADETFEKSDAEELIEAAFKIGHGKKFKNLIIIGEYTLADTEAIKLACSEEGSRYKLADAFVIHTPSQKFLANIYMRFFKPIRPTKFFSERSKAEEWLKSLD